MNFYKSSSSHTFSRWLPTVILVTLCLSLISGCQQTKPLSNREISRKQTSKEKVLYSKNGVVYETDLFGANHRKIFSSHYNLWWEPFKYFPEKHLFVYLALNEQRQSQQTILREYSLKIGRDREVDSTGDLVAFDNKGRILYAKSKTTNTGDDPFALIPPNRLFLYTPDKGAKLLDIRNVRQAVINTEADEFCYASFTPIEQMIDPPSKIYTSKLDIIKPQLIASFPPGTWAVPVSFSNEHIIYVLGKTNSDASDASLYLFDRKARKTRLIKDKVMFITIDTARRKLLAAEKTANSLTDFSVWEIQYEDNSKTKLFNLNLRKGQAGPLIAKYSPDGKCIVVYNGWGNDMELYDFLSKKYTTIFNVKDRIVREFIFTPDSKNILCTIGKPLTDSSIHKDAIYRIELRSGKYVPITKPSKSGGNEIIKIIGVHKGLKANGLNENQENTKSTSELSDSTQPKITIEEVIRNHIPKPFNAKVRTTYLEFPSRWKGNVMPGLTGEMKNDGWVLYDAWGAKQFFAKDINGGKVKISVLPKMSGGPTEKSATTYVYFEMVAD